MDDMTPAQRRRNMQRIRAKDTRPERMLRLALWHKGLRYRKNWRVLPGTPDIALTRQHIAIFVDGGVWHARGHETSLGEQIKTRPEYWRPKLTRNVERDREATTALTQAGWLVLRFWESDIKRDLESIVEEIMAYAGR